MDRLHWADYVIFVLFFIISIGIGVYHALTGGRQRTIIEFIMANRNLQLIPASLSLSMSMMSSTTLVAFSGEAYVYGILMVVWTCVSFTIGVLIIQQVVVVWLYPLQLTSIFEYFDRRFKSTTARRTASCFGIIAAIAVIGVALFAASVAIQTVTDIPVKVSIPVMAGVCTLYTALGGIKAVVWTDVFQGAVVLIGIFAILIKILLLVGPRAAHTIAQDLGRINWANWSFDPRTRQTSWGFIFGLPLFYIYTFGLCQAAAQRHCATSTIREARLAVLLTLPFVVTIITISSVLGLYIFSHFAIIHCDPLADHSINGGSQILPYFVKRAFSENKGFAGYFLAIFCSAALSTVSSSQSACAANLWEDVLSVKLGSRFSEYSGIIFNKILVVFVGLLGMAIGLLCNATSGDLIQIIVSFIGVCGAPIVGMFLLGGLSRKSTWLGTVIGAWTGFAFTMWLLIGSFMNQTGRIFSPLPDGPVDGCSDNKTILLPDMLPNNIDTVVNNSTTWSSLNNLYMLSFMWYQPIGLLVTFVVGIAISHAAGYFDRTLSIMDIEDICMIQWKRVFTVKLNPYCDGEIITEKKKSNDAAEMLFLKPLETSPKEAHA